RLEKPVAPIRGPHAGAQSDDRQISRGIAAEAVADPIRKTFDLGDDAQLRYAGKTARRRAAQGNRARAVARAARHLLGLLFRDRRPPADLAYHLNAADVQGPR